MPKKGTPQRGTRARRGGSSSGGAIIASVVAVAVLAGLLVLTQSGEDAPAEAARASRPAPAPRTPASPASEVGASAWGATETTVTKKEDPAPELTDTEPATAAEPVAPAEPTPPPPPPPMPVTVTPLPEDRDTTFPEDSGIVNVKTEFGAKGDGLTDDTAAIRKAIAHGIEKTSRYASPAFVYFPKGVYIVSDTLESRVSKDGWSSGWRAGMILYGENRSGSVIRLKDNAPGFASPASPKAVIATGSEADKANPKGGGNRAFRHCVINLTVDAGKGNHGAVGIDYVCNNRGCIEDVIIRTPDAGHTGLSLERWWPGPAMCKRVTIEGFDYGIRSAHYQYSMTFEDITLRDQKKLAIRNVQNVLNFRRLKSENSVPAFDGTSGHGTVVIIDSEFTGGDAAATAFTNKGDLFLRNVVVRGYGTAVDNKAGTKKGVPGGDEVEIGEYSSHATVSLFDSPGTSLDLPIAETPEYYTDDFSKWANAKKMGMQEAIDSGAEIVYVPNGSMSCTKTVVIRGKVRKIVGMHSGVSVPKELKSKVDPLFRFEGGHPDGTILEHLRIDGNVEHASSRSLTLRHCDIPKYRNSSRGTGALFLEDTIGPHITITRPQRVWARQWNVEFGDQTQLINKGGVVWILGLKTEVGGEREHWIQIHNERGAVEVLGAIIYPLGRNPVIKGVPCFINDNGAFSATWAMNGGTYEVHMKETRGSETRTLSSGKAQHRGPALYTGYREVDVRRLRRK